jgi:peptidoglycan DL-endopeptidase CwlO
VSVADVTSRISAIQSQLAMLATPSAAGSAAFSSALSSAMRTSATGTTGTATLDPTATTYGTTDATSTGGSAVTGDAVIAEGQKYLGIPYLWGGTDPDKGLDCSGFAQLVYKKFGIDLPRVSRDQANVGDKVEGGLDNAQKGDLLFFGDPVHHVAIYMGDGKMIEAPRTGLDVRETDVYETPSGIRRVIGSSLDPSAAAGAGSLTGLGGVSATSSTPVSGDVPFADLFNQASSEYGVSAKLLSAVAKQESGYNAQAVSPAGAQGLMQLMPGTAAGLGVTDSFDPSQAVNGAAKLLSDLLSRFNGSTPLALAAYNAGPGAVMRYDGVPPYPETQNYVKSIMAMVGQN